MSCCPRLGREHPRGLEIYGEGGQKMIKRIRKEISRFSQIVSPLKNVILLTEEDTDLIEGVTSGKI